MMKISMITTQKSWLKFLLLIGLFCLYFLYLIDHYGIEDGGMVTLLTWSFFVLCTPVADAGFLLDFPIRLLYNIKMIHTEILVWGLAIVISGSAVLFSPNIFEMNALMQIFHAILIHPIPYWLIIFLCGIGTFLSIFMGDQIFDVVESKGKRFNRSFFYKLSMLLALILSISYLYYRLLQSLNIAF